MDTTPNKKVRLEDNQTWSLKASKEIHVESGKLWVTCEGDPEDYILRAGDKFLVPDNGLSVIQSLGKSSFWF